MPKRKDSGLYKITAENEHGKDEAQVEIIVLAAPSRPGGPLKVSDVHDKGCKLKWNKPEDDGGKPLQAYVVEKMDTQTGSWVPVARVDPDKTECPVTGLIPGKQYQFRVKAVNAEGESEPLVTDGPTLAKNPIRLDFSAYIKAFESQLEMLAYEPGKPGKPEIVDWDEKHVDLKWDAPKDDGGAPITGYVVEKKDRVGGHWEPCLETNSSKPEAKVEGLVKGQQYQFRVRAVNKAGPGEHSEPTGTHLCKERFLAPKIVRDNLQNITVRAGHIAKVNVEVIGEPPPKTTWLFNGKELEKSDVVKIEDEDYKTFLCIGKVTRKHSGKYTIKAENSSGKDEETIDILVLDKPSKP
ncbi:hypothetical protein MRX96_017669 [Rhipicephalus microplus]